MAQSLLKQDYKDDISLDDVFALVLETLSQNMDSATLRSEKCMHFFSVIS
jgi:20S proteasome alpha/beta subunit